MRLPDNPLTKGIERLNPRDAEFIYNESDGHRGHAVTLWLFDSPSPDADMTKDQAVAWISQRLGSDLMFTHRLRRTPLAVDHPYWAPAERFDVDDHVRVVPVTGPGWAALGEHLDPVLTAKMNLDRPPWEIHVFTGVAGLDGIPGRLTVVGIKLHHSAVDGLGVVMLAGKLFSADPHLVATAGGAAVPCVRARLLAGAILGAPRGLVRFARVIARGRAAARDVAAVAESGLWAGPQPDRSPNRFNRNPSGSATLQSVVFPADEFRRVRDAVPGATMNDVLLTVVGGALQRYLAGAGERSADSMIAMVPRSMRQIEEWESANQLVVMSVDMHTGIADPVARLALISESARGEKTRTSHIATRRLAAAMDSGPPIVLRLIGELRKPQGMDPERAGVWRNMVSNIPMSVDGMSLNGAACVGMLGSQPPVNKDAVRHFLTVVSGGNLALTVTADRAAMPELPVYIGMIRDSFDELTKAVAL